MYGGSLHSSRDDDDIIHHLTDTITFLSDITDEDLYYVPFLQSVVRIGSGSFLDIDRPVCTTCLTFKNEGPPFLDHLRIGTAAFGTDDESVRV